MPSDDGYCVATLDGSWGDMPCDYERYFACQKDSTYYMIESAGLLTWANAQSYCRQHYTDLPIIHSSVENDQLTAAIIKGYYVWIGLYRDPWEWSDQWDLRFRYWASGQPNLRVGPDCASMATFDYGKWSQESCDYLHPFMCHAEEKRKQVVRLKLSCTGKCQLNDPSLQTAILNQGLPVVLVDDPTEFCKACFASDDGDTYQHVPVEILNQKNENVALRPLYFRLQPSSVGNILEGNAVMDNIDNIPWAMCLFGLTYALHLDYPKCMGNTILFIQHVLLDLDH
ncbi:uncharacterized protein isoform X2 [Danio rerio]|uniref:Uncharacterized protein isoform X2 n=2 Tax=Danio rerio TaxID=7955 RepID=A0AC58HYC2_DANRE